MKINILQWRYSPFLLLGFGMFGFSSAQAQVLCSASSMTPLKFGNVDPLSSQTDASATFSMVCRNDEAATRAATVCLSIGQPRQMINGSNQLNFQLYKDASRTETWGSQFAGALPSALQFNITLGPGASNILVEKTLYGRVLPGQTAAVPGSYTKSYPADNNARVSLEAPTNTTVPNTCNQNPTGKLYFGFEVSANAVNKCLITAKNDIDLGNGSGVPASATLLSSNAALSIKCTKDTPYYIGLLPSNGSQNGSGEMSGTGTNSATKVPYRLRQVAGLGTIWGNTATSTSVGNGKSGTGNGLDKTETVYATAPSADFKPDTYTDTVTINVNY